MRNERPEDRSDEPLPEKIDNKQLMMILFMLRTTTSIGALPVLTIGNAAQDAWAASVLVILGTALIVWLIGGLSIRFKEQTVMQYSVELLGKPMGTVVSLGFLFVFLHFAAISVRVYGEVLVAAFIPSTPMAFITSAMVILAAIAAYLGVETIGRTVDVLSPLYILFIVLGIVVCLSAFDSRSLEPVLARGAKPVLLSTLTPLALGFQYLPLAMLVPFTTRPSRALVSALVSVVLAGAVLITLSVVTVAVLGSDLGHSSLFPFFKALRSIRPTQFFQRVEAFAVAAWGVGILVDASVFLFCGCKGLSQLLGVEDYRPLVGPLAVILIVHSVQAYGSILDLTRAGGPESYFPFIASIALVPYVLLWVAYGIRSPKTRKRGSD